MRAAVWVRGAGAMFAVGWGANQFSSLLLAYRAHAGVSTGVADALFGCYALGLIPALLVAGPLSDRVGRRATARAAVIVSAVASVVLVLGADGVGWLYAGRLLAGVASGTIFAPGTAWVKELSAPPWGRGDADAGARRAAIALSAGFGLGPLVAGVIAQYAPNPLVSPYLAHLLVVAAAGAAVWTVPETRTVPDRRPVLSRVLTPAVRDPRFRRVVAPLAPWVFISASISLAIAPALVARHTGGIAVLFAGLLAGLTLGTGVLVQPLARRLDLRTGGVDGRLPRPVLLLGLLACTAGSLVEAVAAWTGLPAVALPAAVLLGAGYGWCLVGGLLATQRIAPAAELASATAVFYALTYLGFAAPLVLAVARPLAPYPGLLAVVTAAAAGTFVLVERGCRRDQCPDI